MRERLVGRAALLACAVVWLGLPAPSRVAHSQTLRGTVLDERDGLPVLVASALLLDEHGKLLRGSITDSAGAFVLPVPRPGLYGVRVDMPGFAPLLAPPFDIGAGETIEFVIRAGVFESWVDPRTVRRRTGSARIPPEVGDGRGPPSPLSPLP